jgi:hypothetical protein
LTINYLCSKRLGVPASTISRGDYIGMSSKAEIFTSAAEASIKIFYHPKAQRVDGKAQSHQPLGYNLLTAQIFRSDGGGFYQSLGQSYKGGNLPWFRVRTHGAVH